MQAAQCKQVKAVRSVVCAVGVLCTLGSAANGTKGCAETGTGSDRPPPLVLEDKPEWLVPAKPRSEAEHDRIEALALFSAARIRENRQDYAEALRLYQRAFRRDPQSATVVRAIVPLAARLNRHSEAVRYALKLAELDQADPPLLKRLAVYLTEIGDFARALALFEKVAAAAKGAKPSAEDVGLWTEMGRLCYLTGQYPKAAGHFQRVLDALDRPEQFGLDKVAQKTLLAEPGPVYTTIGESFLRAGQPEKAVAAFQMGHKAAANQGLLGYQLAKVALKTGKPDRALQKLQAYFDARLSSEEALPYQLLADALKALNKQGELIERLEKLRAADADNAWLGYFLAEKCFEAQRFDQAEKLFRELIPKRPALIGYRKLIEIYRKGKRYDDLLDVLAEAAGKLGSLEPLGSKGHALAEDGELVRGVLEAGRKRLKSDPKKLSHQARLAVALLAADAKQWDTAEEFFDLAIKSQPDQAAKVLLTWGLGLLVKEEHARAAKVFQRAIDQKALPADDPTFLFYLAGALEMGGRSEPAVAAARKAAEMAKGRAETPKSSGPGKDAKAAKEELPRYLSRVAWVLYHAKRYDEASRGYREIVEKYGEDYSSAGVRQAVREARLVLSNMAVLKDDLPAAEEWLEQVLDEFPDDPSALNDLGYLWADQAKHLDRAHRMIVQAVAKEPDNAAYRDSLGWVLFRKGKVREALPELEKAAAMEPDPTVLDHLGDAYRAAGQADKAKQSWRKAADAHRKAHDEQKAKKVEEKIKSLP